MPNQNTARPTEIRSIKERRPKIAELVAAELRHQIVSGRLKPGDKLQPENVLRAEFEISRPTLREAMRLLEAESLITISRGKHGGPRVNAIDLGVAASQVGLSLQIQGVGLADVWTARIIIEAPAAGLLAERRDASAIAEFRANLDAQREAAQSDLILYAKLSAEFSMLIMQHCGNNTICLLASLIYDIIRRQHEDITERTLSDARIDKLRQESIRGREIAVDLMQSGTREAAESFWRAHLEGIRDLVLKAYTEPMTIDMLGASITKLRPVSKFKRQPRQAALAK